MRRPRKKKPRRPGYGLREYLVEVGDPQIDAIMIRANSMCDAIDKVSKMGVTVSDIHQL